MTTQAGIFDVFGSPAPRSATRPCGPPCVQREVLAHRLTWAFSARSTGRKVVNGGPTGLFLSACYDEHNARNERHRARDGRQRNVVCLFACSVNRSDVNHLFPGRVRKTSPGQTEKTE